MAAFTNASAAQETSILTSFAGTPYLALLTGVITATGGTECLDANYQRHAVTWGAVAGSNPANKANTNAIQAFDKAGATGAAAPQTYTGYALYDAATAGNLLAVQSLAAGVPVGVNAPFTFAAGSITCSAL